MKYTKPVKGGSSKISAKQPAVNTSFNKGPFKKGGTLGGKTNDPGDAATTHGTNVSYGSKMKL